MRGSRSLSQTIVPKPLQDEPALERLLRGVRDLTVRRDAQTRRKHIPFAWRPHVENRQPAECLGDKDSVDMVVAVGVTDHDAGGRPRGGLAESAQQRLEWVIPLLLVRWSEN